MSISALGLMGSGEFTRAATPIDEWLLTRSTNKTGRALIVPTASAREGDDVFEKWIAMGIEHYESLGLEPVPVRIREREDASKREWVDLLEGAQLVFFSGGNPGYLVRTFRETPFWNELVASMKDGVSFGGCSAGAVFIGALAPDVPSSDVVDMESLKKMEWLPGLGVLPHFFIGAHWDMLDTYVPGLTTVIRSLHPVDTVLVGIDEETGLCGDGTNWQVLGEKSVLIVEHGRELSYRPGDSFRIEYD